MKTIAESGRKIDLRLLRKRRQVVCTNTISAEALHGVMRHTQGEQQITHFHQLFPS